MTEDLYLGIDGGQSHTGAVIADSEGNVKGRGHSGPSNHAEQPGGRERLQRAIIESVGNALQSVVGHASAAQREHMSLINRTVFAAAHCAMTGGAEFKEEVIGGILHARILKVGHDAPAALAGATGGEAGIVVIAGTGSVAYGEKANGDHLQVGGWGHLFGDEGSGFWIALQGIRRAMQSYDGLSGPTALTALALQHFSRPDLRTLALDVYGEKITRDSLATFAEQVHQAAVAGDHVAREVIAEAGQSLAMLALTAARRLNLSPDESRIACVGGVFRGALVREAFAAVLGENMAAMKIMEPRFDPAIGALLLAYRAAGCEKSERLLLNLEKQAVAGLT